MSSLFALGLRVVTIATKTYFFFGLTNWFSIVEVGVLGVFAGVVSFISSTAGIELYQYSNRLVLMGDRSGHKAVIATQFSFYYLMAAILAIATLVVFKNHWISLPFTWAIVGIVALDLVCTEYSRMLFALKMPGSANVVLFLKQASWALVSLIAFEFSAAPEFLSIFTYWFWTLVAAVVASELALSMRSCSIFQLERPSMGLFRLMAAGAIPFVIASVAGNLLEYADRVLFAFLLSNTDLGAFILLNAVAVAIRSLCFYGSASISFPYVVEAYGKRDFKRYRAALLLMSSRMVALVFFAAVGLEVGYEHFRSWFFSGVTELTIERLRLMVVLAAIAAAAFPLHYMLYARKKDMLSMFSSLIGLSVLVVLAHWFTSRWGLDGALYVELLAYGAVVASKSVALAHADRRDGPR